MDLAHLIASLTDMVVAHRTLTYAIIFVGSYLDAIVGVNFILRGEIFFLAGSILAGTGVLNIWLVSFLILGASILGDHTSYWIGLRYGNLLFKKGRWVFNPENHQKGEKFFNKFGAKSVLLARLLGPLTWITPFMAGLYRVRYREFLAYNIPGVLLGVGQFLVVGYFFGASYVHVLALGQEYFFLALLVIGAAIFLFHLVKKRIAQRLDAE